MSATFPLRDDFFPPVKISPQQEAEWVNLMHDVIQQTIMEETPYFDTKYKKVDPNLWHQIKSEHEIRGYWPTEANPLFARTTYKNMAVSLSMGTMLGRVDDLMLGIRTVNNSEAQLYAKFMGYWLDHKILADLNVRRLPGQQDDQSAALQVKWRLLRTPGGKFVRYRDVTILEYMGMTTDAYGRPLGFLIIYSIELPEIPPFPSEYNTVRMINRIMYIFRQVSDETMGVFLRAEAQLDGNMGKSFKKRTTLDVGFGIPLKGIEFGEAKKLTLFALSDSPVLKSPGGQSRFLTNSDSLKSSTCGICGQKGTRSFASLKSVLGKSRLSTCLVCGMTVCGSCSLKKPLLARKSMLLVNCCKQCVIRAQRMRTTTLAIFEDLPGEKLSIHSGSGSNQSEHRASNDTSVPFRTISERRWMDGLEDSPNAEVRLSEDMYSFGDNANATEEELSYIRDDMTSAFAKMKTLSLNN